MRTERKIGDADQYVLLIWGVFRGQKTEAVTSSLQEQKILNEYIPDNMSDYFQVLDLTVNKWVKDFIKPKFNKWFATQLRNELESGKELENITIKFILSTMKGEEYINKEKVFRDYDSGDEFCDSENSYFNRE